MTGGGGRTGRGHAVGRGLAHLDGEEAPRVCDADAVRPVRLADRGRVPRSRGWLRLGVRWTVPVGSGCVTAMSSRFA